MKWIEERDALIAQTKAFVEAVSRRSADSGRSAAARLQPAAVALSSAPPPPAAPVTNTSAPRAPAAPAPAAKTSATTSAMPTLAPLERKFDQVSMSSEIRSRIAAFRAHQERFNRERHEYFNATLARLRAEINELPAPVRRQADGAALGRRPDLTLDQSRAAAGAPPQRRPEGRT
ncbi:hypothetical protein [Bradyrhizobium sp.]|uniref:hypothetical protein n=2 Tax=Bradyrhizobium sp. TaxID=376 RepID=UPI001EB15C57|nr:hypothetical protein [Bradyrhizobium sp.]MBV9979248.1 hypothetical protein [Bradyrhizobium sp.]